MEEEGASRLREKARRYREMSNCGNDPILVAALLETADDFDKEAAKLDGQPEQQPRLLLPSIP
jgi:hypothetical protein